ncbi:exosortase [Pseudaeromonas sharmana]|uniref:Exosortase n=1 Tax=Pseudaeromonas sharmana TaxID=328412 RepID=A0ABV8CN80_9GAMM
MVANEMDALTTYKFKLGTLLLTLVLVYLPLVHRTYFEHGENLGGSTSALLLVMAIVLFLYRLSAFRPQPTLTSQRLAWLLMLIGSLLFFIGNVLLLPMLTVGSILPVLAASVLFLLGWQAFRAALFPLTLLLFVIPLPYMMTDFIVQPLKLLISHATEWLLYHAGYPVARNGVILILGDYQLLIADACSGINSLFSLEAIGLLYLHVMKKESALRNWLIGMLIIPISITANIIRVLILALLTYYLGNDAGQSFMHDLSGLLLFAVALSVIIALDGVLDRVLPVRQSVAVTEGATSTDKPQLREVQG